MSARTLNYLYEKIGKAISYGSAEDLLRLYARDIDNKNQKEKEKKNI